MIDLASLHERAQPFRHWVSEAFVSREMCAEINATWPAPEDGRWYHERGKAGHKSSILFPRRPHDAAMALARHCYSTEVVAAISGIVGEQLIADPWFEDGPLEPKTGGGIHEIHPGGFLKVHVDFNKHPLGYRRALNLLIYFNPAWQPEWNGALELHGKGAQARIEPEACTAAMFQTNQHSWHGHPRPLTSPRPRRSLALY